MSTIQSTPLEALHVRLGARMVPFAGWNMPVQYTSIMDEHGAVRSTAGIFDISHMGQFIVSGPGALAWLNHMLANNVAKLEPGQGQYSFLLNKNGGVIDDLIVYRTGDESFFLVVNASMIDEDFNWMANHQPPEDVWFTNESAQWAGMAVQGPDSAAVFAKACPGQELPPRNGIVRFPIKGGEAVVCRTGYTGEDGFEFFCTAELGEAWFEKFIANGAKACGLGARDSLRLEMCYPLNGSDLSPERTPIEAGLGFFVDLDKGDFIGRETLARQKAEGPAERLVALEYTDKGAPPRSHYPLQDAAGQVISELSSGVLSPSLGKGIAMAYVPAALAKPGTELFVDVRGRLFPAKVVKKPFYKPAGQKA
ncbi:glycine cleavage system aminomethyltransferase GcvT [Luteolibacter sp. GHJ8]|uniref:Aminomethyltransferase n=1 Tax=Luteolibacter rhizosphaerae TaxID=2989719 RepID=A0ABT3GAM4_9BACT|nr:glycine cleavage system aminomethyltransferase GcvT [Luteolibacter rhizosphaerae]MCW1916882.1 glycine cleavage system aminomethyltransferase GcvT [Luteolibacter rhizosphaerae]